jgi:hypothetical protein
MAPEDRAELDANLSILDSWQPMPPAEYAALAAHGDRVRRHAPDFP